MRAGRQLKIPSRDLKFEINKTLHIITFVNENSHLSLAGNSSSSSLIALFTLPPHMDTE